MASRSERAVNALAAFFSSYIIFVALGFYLIVLMLVRNAFNLTIPSYLVLTPMQHMGMFLAGILLLAFVLYPIKEGKPKIYDWILGIIASTSGFYMFLIYPQLMLRMGIVTLPDIIFALIAIFFLVEAGRRTVGLALAVLTGVFLLYGFWDAGFDVGSLATRVYLYNVGIFSIPFQVATFMIFIFLFFGTLLSEIGVGEYFTNLAFSLTGSRKGGPAKVAVVASSMLGMMTGSATGNVVTTGTFTIPLMKKTGYKPETAAAIEASASTGGQIMPPVLGSAAFIMPLFLGMRYWDIVVASVIPALVYYAALYIFVDQEASKQRIFGLPKEQLPPLRPLLKKAYFLLPLAVLVYVLSSGFSVEHSAIASIMTALLIEWFTRRGIKRMFASIFLTMLFLFGFLLSSARLDLPSVLIVLGAIAILVTMAVGVVLKGAREMTIIVYRSLYTSFKTVIPIALACALAGVIAGVLAYTGLAQVLSNILIEISGGNLLLLLLLVMAVSIILGMGMPTPAVYVLGATMLAPALVAMGVPAIAVHFFIFYFGVMAPLTPPVAVTAYAGAAIAKADFWRTGIEAFRAALTAWFIAFAFVAKPEMLIIPIKSMGMAESFNLLVGIGTSFIAALASIGIISGYLFGPLNKLQRVIMVAVLALILIGLYYYESLLVVAFILLLGSTMTARFKRARISGS